ncbi:MAG: sarcosine oxidase subunit alpha family protein [Pseudomonadota bacterium]
MTATRLAKGGRVERDTSLAFQWDGRGMLGLQGDSLASALLANDEWVIARSFKYHRPRGVMSAGVEEGGALVTVGSGARTDANVRATTQELYSGLEAYGQNAWPNVRTDVGEVNNLLGRFFAAGFYYKTFMGLPPFEWGKGTWLWMQYEKIIRRAAGMGRASREPDPDHYEHAHGFCDVLVVGSGPAGLAAARTAAEAGLDVLLVEQDNQLGGDYLNQPVEGDANRVDAITAAQSAGVRVMTRTTAFGLYDGGVAGLIERVTDHLSAPSIHQPRQRFWTVRAKYTVLASGAIERTMAFGNNDRPGIQTANAGRAYLNRYAVRVGSKLVVATNNDSAYTGAMELAASGASVRVLDARARIDESLAASVLQAGVHVEYNTAPLRAHGRAPVQSLTTARADGAGWGLGSDVECDALLVSGGWSPVVNLLSHRQVKPVWHAELACFLPADSNEPIAMAGSAAGVWQTADCVRSGEVAGAQAARALGAHAADVAPPEVGGWQTPIKAVYEVRVPGRTDKAFIDPQHDVSTEDVRLAHREGYVSVEHMKRYTTLGMATDQGKMGNIIGLALMAEALGREIGEVGTTTFRPPYTPVAIGALRGRHVGAHFRPLRVTPMHQWNLDHGATMTMAGLWHRPWYFAREGEGITEAYIREATTVRESVGLVDVTSLGKIAIQGPDATEFLNRVYTNPFAKLPIGKTRYGIMLRDDGVVMDDGTTWRLAENDYFMTTTTAHAGSVMVFLEELLQTRWTDLKVHLTSVSEQWAGVAVAGPQSRDGLEAALEDPAVVGNDVLPFMGVVETHFKGGIPCRIARISFSGERAFEAYVPSDYGPAMMDLLWPATEQRGGCLYGLEALGALRIEKGHVTGAELDGRVTIDDAGLGKMASPNKHFVGSALRHRPEMQRDDRPQLVGIFPKDRSETFNAGCILTLPDAGTGHGEGWITGVTHSPALGHWIGLGFVKGGHAAWQGKTAVAADPVRDSSVEVEFVSPHMYDPSGERMHG